MLQSNATLLEVASVSPDDYEAPGARTAKWVGSEACYLEDKTVRVTTSAGSEPQRQWTIYMPVDLEVDWALGDQVTIRTAGHAAPRTYTVPIQAIAVRDDPTMPLDVCTVALTVEPASA